MNAVRSSILALVTTALATGTTGCAWLLSGGDRAAAANTVPLEITNSSNQAVCSVKVWGDKPQAQLPEHKLAGEHREHADGCGAEGIPSPTG